MSSMNQLSGDTVRLITSSQVITSVYSVVKELLENALDANADNIDVKLENYGFDKIELRDNGDGITPENATYMAQKHYTSKISNHGDLEDLETYGFRGEALGSLCAVSTVTIATKTKLDAVSRLYTLDHHGKIETSKPSHIGNGTTVTTTNLFKNIPVRKQYYSNVKRRKEELKKVEDLLMSYGAIRCDIRVSLSHNKKPIWQKNKTTSQRGALLNTWGSGVMKQMIEVQKTDTITQVSIEAYLPKPSSDPQLISRAQGDRCWINVNKRPVNLKELEKIVKQYYCSSAKQTIHSNTIRNLVMFMSITMPTNLVDVNLEPNKTKVLLQNTDAILSLLTDMLQEVYGPLHTKSNTEKVTVTSSGLDKNNADSTSQESSTDDEGIGHNDNTSNGIRSLSSNNNKVDVTKSSTVMRMSNWQNGNQSMPSGDEVRPRSEVTWSSIEKHVGLGENPENGLGENTSHLKNNEESFLPPLPKFDLTGILESSSIDMFDSSINETQELASTVNHPLSVTFNTSDPKNTTETSTNPPIAWETSHLETRTNDRTNLLETTSDADSLNEIPSVTDVEWSRGVGLTDHQGCSIEPSMLLVPGKFPINDQLVLNNSTNQTSTTTSEGVRRLSTNQNTDRRELLANQHSELGDNSTNQDSERKEHTSSFSTNHNSDKESIEFVTNQMPNSDRITNQKVSPGTLTNHKGSPRRCRKPLEQMTGQTTLYDLVGSSTVRKPQRAFSLFSNQLRPSVVKDNPSLDLAAIGSLLWEKWEELSDGDREEYVQLSQKDAQRYKEQIKSAANKETSSEKNRSEGLHLPARKKKKLEKLANQNLIDEMLASQRAKSTHKEKLKSPTAVAVESAQVKEIQVAFDIQRVKKQLTQHTQNRINDDRRWNLIGQISSNNLWLALHQQQLVLINQYRIQEALFYNRLMATHILPVEQLDIPVVLKSRMLGGDENWVSLLSLQSIVTPPNPDHHYIDERLKSNGFHIKQSTDIETQDVRLEVIAMATSISYYGIDDLREILDLITQGGSNLAQCRPLKISNYLKAEAMRMARGLSSHISREDVHDILSHMEEHLLPGIQTCLHDKPYLHVMHHMQTGDEV